MKKSKKSFATLNRIMIIQLVLMLALVLGITKTVSERTRKNSLEHMNTIADERAQIIDNYVTNVEKTLTNYSKAKQIIDAIENPDDAELQKAAQKYTERFSKDVDNLEGIYVSLWTTQVLAHTDIQYVGMITRKDPEPLKQLQDAMLKAGDGVYNTGIIISPASKKQIVSMYKAVYNDKGEPVGLVGIGIYTEGLINTLDNLKIRGIEDSSYSMVNVANNAIIFNVDKEKVGTETDNTDIINLCNKFRGSDKSGSGNFEYKKNGKKYISTYTYMPSHGWILMIDDAKKEVYALTIAMRFFLGIFGLIILGLIIVFNFISRRQALINEKLTSTIKKNAKTKESLAVAMYQDVLTGAGNRISFAKDIEAAEGSAEHPYYFLMCNISDFSGINAQYGNDAGDAVLANTASTLEDVFEGQKVYRTGSDEFVVMIKANAEETTAKDIMNQVNMALRQLSIAIDTPGGNVYAKYKMAVLKKSYDINTAVITVLKDIVNLGGVAMYGQVEYRDFDEK